MPPSRQARTATFIFGDWNRGAGARVSASTERSGETIMPQRILCFLLGAVAPMLSIGWLIAYH